MKVTTPIQIGIQMQRTYSVSSVATILVIFLSAAFAQAESRVDITTSIAYFNPTKNVIDQDGVAAKFAGAVGFGGRLSIWLNESVSLEASGHYGRTTLDGQAFGNTESLDLALFYGSAQLAIALGEEKRFLIHGGIGLQGTNYDEFIEGGNILTGVLGITGTLPLSPTTALRADLDAHFHTSFFEIGDQQTDELSQLDTVLSVGIQFTP